MDLITVDMTSSWDWKTNASIKALTKKESGSVAGLSSPPSIRNGALYGGSDNSHMLYQFGGTTSGFNGSFPFFEIPPTTQYAIWTYDTVAGIWAAQDTSPAGITIPS